MLTVEGVSVRYGSLVIVDEVSFALQAGQWLMIVGPNGAGKSTLINAITAGTPCTGRVTFEGRDVLSMRPAARAKCLGVLMQSYSPGYAFTVEEVVRLGRYAWRDGLLGGARAEDTDKVEAALAETGLVPMRGQSILTLSGGELQRTFLAQVLAQDPKLLILDEPANHLDLSYQKQVFDLIEAWRQKPGRAAISVVHDLSLARAYGTHAMLMDKGKAISCGEKAAVMAEDNLDGVYNMDVGAWMRTMLEQWA